MMGNSKLPKMSAIQSELRSLEVGFVDIMFAVSYEGMGVRIVLGI